MNFLKNFKEKRLLGGKLGSKNFYLNFIKRIRKRVDGMTRVGGTSWNKVNHVSGYRLSILPRPSVYTRRLMSRQGMYKSSGAQASSARIKVGSKLCSISKITTIIRHRECDIASVKPRAVTLRPCFLKHSHRSRGFLSPLLGSFPNRSALSLGLLLRRSRSECELKILEIKFYLLIKMVE